MIRRCWLDTRKFASAALKNTVMAAFAFLFLYFLMDVTVSIYDEGLILEGAERVRAGGVIHRDFYANYGPAQFYVLAALFKLFSAKIMVLRVWDTIVKTALATVCYLVAGRFAGPKKAFAVWFFILCLLCDVGYFGYPVFPALLLVLIGVYALIPVFAGEARALPLVAAGLCAGMAALFRYDIGFVTCAVETLVVAAYAVTSGRGGAPGAVRLVSRYWAGIGAVCLPVAAAYLQAGVVKDLWFQVVTFPGHNYAATRSLPFPPFGIQYNVLIYLPVLVWIVAVIVLCTYRRRPKDAYFWSFLLITVLSMVFYMKGVVRVSIVHMICSIVPCLLLLAISSTKGALARAGVIICVGVSLFGFQRLVAHKYLYLGRSLASAMSSSEPHDTVERLGYFRVGDRRVEAAKYILKSTSDNDYIFCGTTRHDKVFVNDVALYFIANRTPATKWYHYDPGLQTMLDIQERMIKDLEKNKPKVVVLEATWDNVAEPNRSAVSSGVLALDYYLAAKYRCVGSIEDIFILQRI